ncbi:MAG: hypothetical protein PHQ65_09390 [Bacteroidales bacterium]|nr:hypothetical protein [Bacteroidales bacterium]MDD3665462.1 hypothetical protein [Bacteroidales bacterium]
MNTSMLLHLKATCLGSDVAKPDDLPYRTLLVPVHLSIYQMAVAVLNSFEFDSENFFSFYQQKEAEGKPLFEKSSDKLPVSKKKDVKKNLVDKMFKEEGDTWFMLFDYEDRWWFSIELSEISYTMPVGKYPRVVETMFDNPVQYPLKDAERASEEENHANENHGEVKEWFVDIHHDELSEAFKKVLADAIEELNRLESSHEYLSDRLGKEFSLANLVDLYFSVRERLMFSGNYMERAMLIVTNWTAGNVDVKLPAFRVLTVNDKAELLLGKAYLSHSLGMKDLAEQANRIAPENIPGLLLLALLSEEGEKIKLLKRAERLICLKLGFSPDRERTPHDELFDEPLFYDLLDVWRDLSVAYCEDGSYAKAIAPALNLLRWSDEEKEPAHEMMLPLLVLHQGDFKRFQPWYEYLRQRNKNAAAYHWILYESLTGASEEAVESAIEKALKANAEIAVALTSDSDEDPVTEAQMEALEYFNACADVWFNYPELLAQLESALADFRP